MPLQFWGPGYAGKLQGADAVGDSTSWNGHDMLSRNDTPMLAPCPTKACHPTKAISEEI